MNALSLLLVESGSPVPPCGIIVSLLSLVALIQGDQGGQEPNDHLRLELGTTRHVEVTTSSKKRP